MTLAALSAMISVAAGAFAAHGIRDAHAKELLQTGAHYQFMHAMATLACATFMQIGARRARFAPALFLAGGVIFSGSLYALALGAPRWVGAITEQPATSVGLTCRIALESILSMSIAPVSNARNDFSFAGNV